MQEKKHICRKTCHSVKSFRILTNQIWQFDLREQPCSPLDSTQKGKKNCLPLSELYSASRCCPDPLLALEMMTLVGSEP